MLLSRLIRPGTRWVLGLSGMLTLMASSAAEPPGAAPATNSPAIFISAAQLSGEIQAAVAKGTDPALGNLGVTTEYFMHQVRRSKIAPAAAHPGWTELHFILDGSGTFVTGGTIQGKPGAPGATIVGGVTHKVHKGDAILVPPNTPHWYQQLDDDLNLLEIRFISPSAAAQMK